MGRPKMDEAKKKVSINISVTPNIDALARSTGNSSLFFEHCVGVASGVTAVFADFKDGKINKNELLEEIATYTRIYSASFEESIPAAALKERSLSKTGS